jgi:hypothetical protein
VGFCGWNRKLRNIFENTIHVSAMIGGYGPVQAAGAAKGMALISVMAAFGFLPISSACPTATSTP